MNSSLTWLGIVVAALASSTVLSGCSDDQPSATATTTPTATCEYDGTGELPVADPTVTGTVQRTIATSQGDIAITLDADAAPCAVNSFLYLADERFFDETVCHRLVTAPSLHALQCGSKNGLGNDDAGYRFDDELTGQERYSAGTLAMANAGPNTNGSQFFLVFEDSQLNPDYTVFGSVGEAGLETLRTIGAERVQSSPDVQDGAPAEDVRILEVRATP